jgi:hypothetical protein
MIARRGLMTAAGAALAGCAGAPAAPPLAALGDGRELVLSPPADFDPQRPPEGWSVARPELGASFSTVAVAGRPALRVGAPSGATLLRSTGSRLLATPYAHWAWSLETALYGGGPGDGLARGLRLTIGFAGGAPSGLTAPDRWFRSDSGFPPHDRRLEIALAGVGAARPELASIEFAAIADGGQRRPLRALAADQTGGWHLESVDLAALHRGFWPADRQTETRIVFVGIGGTPARLPAGVPGPVGHAVEIQLSR